MALAKTLKSILAKANNGVTWNPSAKADGNINTISKFTYNLYLLIVTP